MRIFIADTSVWFLIQMQRMFRSTPVDHTYYAATLALEPHRFFQASSSQQNMCLVTPCDTAAKLTLEQCTESKYKLTCPTPTCSNTRVLVKQILRFIKQQDVAIDVIVLPPMGERTLVTAHAMYCGITDVLPRTVA